jgi:hypothetical protein
MVVVMVRFLLLSKTLPSVLTIMTIREAAHVTSTPKISGLRQKPANR